MDLIRRRDVTELRPCEFTSSVIYTFPFQTYFSEPLVGVAWESIFLLNGPLRDEFHD